MSIKDFFSHSKRASNNNSLRRSEDRYIPGKYVPGPYVDESKAFFRECVGDEMYDRVMGKEIGRRHHYVPARLFLDQSNWKKFAYIEQFGSLEGFPGGDTKEL